MPSIAIVPSTKGFHWEEVFDAYDVFKLAGWNILFYSVDGSTPKPDPMSIQNRPILSYFGLGLRSSYSPETTTGQELTHHLALVKPISEINTEKLDAIYIPGGHGCLFDVNINADLHQKIKELYGQHKIIGAVCHGSSSLAFVKDDNGNAIIKGKKISGFPNLLDNMLLKLNLIAPEFLPLPYSNEDKIKAAGAIMSEADIMMSLLNPTFYVIDLPFITGVGPKAAKPVAENMLRYFEAQ